MKCSVLLPVYDGERTLRQAIDSILLQTEKDFEFLIIDDCSPDGSADLIREYARLDSRIRPVFHERNAGLSGTLNEGLALARSEFVVRMDQDDESMPDRLRQQIRFMNTRPEVAAAGSYVFHMGRSAANDRLVELPAEHDEIMQILPRQNCMYHPAMILRREAVLRAGGYRAEFRNAEDYDLWLRLSRTHRLANLRAPLLRYRFSTSGMSLGRRWEQMLYVQMAIAAYADPSLEGPELAEAARRALDLVNKRNYFKEVAKGTLAELTRLGNWKDAWKAFVIFAPHLGALSAIGVACQTAGLAWNRYPARNGATI